MSAIPPPMGAAGPIVGPWSSSTLVVYLRVGLSKSVVEVLSLFVVVSEDVIRDIVQKCSRAVYFAPS